MSAIHGILKYFFSRRESRVTSKTCPECKEIHTGSATKCSCGFPLAPPRRVMTSTGSRPLNYEEIVLWSKDIGNEE